MLPSTATTRRSTRTLALLALALGASACTSAQVVTSEPTTEVVRYADVEWGPLNAARGDASPRAGDLWGDRTGPGATGFLVQFADGFSSPPHIHNVTYRGVVLRGLLHNDDPDAEEMWLPPGSYWTQPAGDVHVTSADAAVTLAYIEIQDGPYLVRPTDQAFAGDDVEINQDASNLIWLDASDLVWVGASGDAASGPKVALLWGDPQEGAASGSLVELPAGFAGTIRGRGASLRAVVVQGTVGYHTPGETVALEPGSYVGFDDAAALDLACSVDEACLVYVRAEGGFDVLPAVSD
jgi:quercetin dioxygenase-like cupin family protein